MKSSRGLHCASFASKNNNQLNSYLGSFSSDLHQVCICFNVSHFLCMYLLLHAWTEVMPHLWVNSLSFLESLLKYLISKFIIWICSHLGLRGKCWGAFWQARIFMSYTSFIFRTWSLTFCSTQLWQIWLIVKVCAYIFSFLMFIDIVQSSRGRRLIPFKGSVKFVQTSCRLSIPGISPRNEQKAPSNMLRDKKAVPYANPPSIKDVNLLYQFFDNRLIYTYLSNIRFFRVPYLWI